MECITPEKKKLAECVVSGRGGAERIIFGEKKKDPGNVISRIALFSYNAKSVSVRLFCRDSTCWAFCFACSTFQTCICIDFVFSITFVDSFSWTCFCTCSAAYTFIRNNVCHNKNPPYIMLDYFFTETERFCVYCLHSNTERILIQEF